MAKRDPKQLVSFGTHNEYSMEIGEFEDFIEQYTSLDQLVELISLEFGWPELTKADLDSFTRKVYNRSLKDAYFTLRNLSNLHNRKALNTIAKQGNQTAIKYIVEQCMQEHINDAPRIQFVCNVPQVKSDLDLLAEDDSNNIEEDK